MKFTFKIGQKIKETWPIYKANFSTILILIAITIVTKFIGSDSHNWGLVIVSYVISILISYIWIRFILGLIDKKDFNPFSRKSLPSFKRFWNLLTTLILSGLCILGGFILLIIPGFYIIGRLIFSVYISVDKNKDGVASVKESWNMTKGYGWNLFWKGLLISLFIILGYIAFLVGALITYPIGIMVMAMMYREFSKIKSHHLEHSPTLNKNYLVKEVTEEDIKEGIPEIKG